MEKKNEKRRRPDTHCGTHRVYRDSCRKGPALVSFLFDILNSHAIFNTVTGAGDHHDQCSESYSNGPSCCRTRNGPFFRNCGVCFRLDRRQRGYFLPCDLRRSHRRTGACRKPGIRRIRCLSLRRTGERNSRSMAIVAIAQQQMYRPRALRGTSFMLQTVFPFITHRQ